MQPAIDDLINSNRRAILPAIFTLQVWDGFFALLKGYQASLRSRGVRGVVSYIVRALVTFNFIWWLSASIFGISTGVSLIVAGVFALGLGALVILAITMPLQFFVSMPVRFFESVLPDANVAYTLLRVSSPTEPDWNVRDLFLRFGRWMAGHVSVIHAEMTGGRLVTRERAYGYIYRAITANYPNITNWADLINHNLRPGATNEERLAAYRHLYLLSQRDPYGFGHAPHLVDDDPLVHRRVDIMPVGNTEHYLNAFRGLTETTPIRRPMGPEVHLFAPGSVRPVMNRTITIPNPADPGNPHEIEIEERFPATTMRARIHANGTNYGTTSFGDSEPIEVTLNDVVYRIRINDAENVEMEFDVAHAGRRYLVRQVFNGETTTSYLEERLPPVSWSRLVNKFAPTSLVATVSINTTTGVTVYRDNRDRVVPESRYSRLDDIARPPAPMINYAQTAAMNSYGFVPSATSDMVVATFDNTVKLDKHNGTIHYLMGIPYEHVSTSGTALEDGEEVLAQGNQVRVGLIDVRQRYAPEVTEVREQVDSTSEAQGLEGRDNILDIGSHVEFGARYEVQGQADPAAREEHVDNVDMLQRLGLNPHHRSTEHIERPRFRDRLVDVLGGKGRSARGLTNIWDSRTLAYLTGMRTQSYFFGGGARTVTQSTMAEEHPAWLVGETQRQHGYRAHERYRRDALREETNAMRNDLLNAQEITIGTTTVPYTAEAPAAQPRAPPRRRFAAAAAVVPWFLLPLLDWVPGGSVLALIILALQLAIPLMAFNWFRRQAAPAQPPVQPTTPLSLQERTSLGNVTLQLLRTLGNQHENRGHRPRDQADDRLVTPGGNDEVWDESSLVRATALSLSRDLPALTNTTPLRNGFAGIPDYLTAAFRQHLHNRGLPQDLTMEASRDIQALCLHRTKETLYHLALLCDRGARDGSISFPGQTARGNRRMVRNLATTFRTLADAVGNRETNPHEVHGTVQTAQGPVVQTRHYHDVDLAHYGHMAHLMVRHAGIGCALANMTYHGPALFNRGSDNNMWFGRDPEEHDAFRDENLAHWSRRFGIRVQGDPFQNRSWNWSDIIAAQTRLGSFRMTSNGDGLEPNVVLYRALPQGMPEETVLRLTVPQAIAFEVRVTPEPTGAYTFDIDGAEQTVSLGDTIEIGTRPYTVGYDNLRGIVLTPTNAGTTPDPVILPLSKRKEVPIQVTVTSPAVGQYSFAVDGGVSQAINVGATSGTITIGTRNYNVDHGDYARSPRGAAGGRSIAEYTAQRTRLQQPSDEIDLRLAERGANMMQWLRDEVSQNPSHYAPMFRGMRERRRREMTPTIELPQLTQRSIGGINVTFGVQAGQCVLDINGTVQTVASGDVITIGDHEYAFTFDASSGNGILRLTGVDVPYDPNEVEGQIQDLEHLSEELVTTGKLMPGSEDARILCSVFGVDQRQLSCFYDKSEYAFVAGPPTLTSKFKLSLPLGLRRGSRLIAWLSARRPLTFAAIIMGVAVALFGLAQLPLVMALAIALPPLMLVSLPLTVVVGGITALFSMAGIPVWLALLAVVPCIPLLRWYCRSVSHVRPVNVLSALFAMNEPPWSAPLSGFNCLPHAGYLSMETDTHHRRDGRSHEKQ
jgi:hypothetical protein